MYALNTSTMTIEGFLASTVASVQPHFIATIYDVRQEQKPDYSEYFRAPVLTTFAGVTTVTLISAPGVNVFRKVERIQAYNNDTTTHTFTFRYNNNSVTTLIWKPLVAPGEVVDLIRLKIV